VLTDAAPLVISAETEYLARFVDCAIVVAESGVTTRAQLLAAATRCSGSMLRLWVFIEFAFGLAKADPAFRNSIREIEIIGRPKSRPAAEWPRERERRCRGSSALARAASQRDRFS